MIIFDQNINFPNCFFCTIQSSAPHHSYIQPGVAEVSKTGPSLIYVAEGGPKSAVGHFTTE